MDMFHSVAVSKKNARKPLHGLVCEGKTSTIWWEANDLLKSINVSPSTESRVTDGPDISENVAEHT